MVIYDEMSQEILLYEKSVMNPGKHFLSRVLDMATKAIKFDAGKSTDLEFEQYAHLIYR